MECQLEEKNISARIPAFRTALQEFTPILGSVLRGRALKQKPVILDLVFLCSYSGFRDQVHTIFILIPQLNHLTGILLIKFGINVRQNTLNKLESTRVGKSTNNIKLNTKKKSQVVRNESYRWEFLG